METCAEMVAELHALGMRQNKIAEIAGLSVSGISLVLKRGTMQELKPEGRARLKAALVRQRRAAKVEATA